MASRLRDERGMTVIEVVVAGAVLFAALAVVSAVLVASQVAVVDQDRRTVINDEVRAAMEQLDREVRSSGFILTLDQHTLLVHTQSNAPSYGERCVQWRVHDERLQRREWPIDHPESASGWRVIAEGVVNAEIVEPTFVLPTTASNRVTTGGRSVDVTFLVNPDRDRDPDATAVVAQFLSGRNVAAAAPAPGITWPPTSPPPPCEVLP